MTYFLYPLFGFFFLLNIYYAINGSVTYSHLFWTFIVALVSVFSVKQTIKCWQLQLPPEASEYYLDILALNSIVAIFDSFTHKIW